MNSQVGPNNHKNSNVVYQDLTTILGIGRFDSGNLSAGLPLKCDMDPANLVRTRTIRSENGLKPAEHSSDSLQDMSSPCESPHAGKVKFMCSFGGKILPRPSDGVLRYVGGETRLISIPRNFSWKELVRKTLSLYNQPHTIKYQLPDEDLDALISLSCEEDLQNMMEEYYSLEKANGSPRLRIFLVSPNDCEETSLSARSLESEPEYHFVVAVNNLSQLKQSTSGNNLVSQLSQQLDNSLLPGRDSTACQADIESGGKALAGTALNESSSQFFLAPYSQQMVAESAATSSPGLNRQRMSLNQSRLRMSADKLTTNQEHEHKYEVSNGSHLKTMLPDHQDKIQSNADTGVGIGSTMHNIQIQRQAKDLGIPRNESYVSSHTSYDKSTPMEMPFYSEKVCVHPEAASWLSGMHEYTGQIHGMPHAFSDPLLNDRTEQPASNLSLTFDSYIPPSFSQTMCQANALERTISGTRPDLLCAKPPQIARMDEPNYLVSSHTDQRYDQGVPGGASFEAAVYYQQDSLSSNMVQTGHDSGPVVQQRKIYHPENSAGPTVAPQCTFVDTRFTLHHTRGARLSSGELDALESSGLTSMHATDNSHSRFLHGSQTANSDRGSHVEKMNSGRVSTDYGTAGCVHGNDKVAPGPPILLPIDPFEAFAPKRSVANGAYPVYQNENFDQLLVHSSGLATSSPIGLSNADLTGNMFGNGTFKDGLSQRDVPVFNQHNIICSDVGVIGATINTEDMNLKGRMHNNFQMEARAIVEDVTDNMPSGIPSSRPIPQVEMAAEEQHHAIISSEKDDDAKSDGPELANEV
uniref:PB1 domain-containing protein n=1 Tax=Aegilops tauschii subsp. strangulata TaxID=200361 RepID=A0A453JTC7_AEGTS